MNLAQNFIQQFEDQDPFWKNFFEIKMKNYIKIYRALK